MRFCWLASVCLAASAFSVALPARADGGPSIEDASYSAPEGCETAASFRDRLRTTTTTPAPYVVRVRRTDGGFEGRAQWLARGSATKSERAFASPSCDDVTHGLALAVGLADAPEPEAEPPSPSSSGPTSSPRTHDAVSKMAEKTRSDLLFSVGLSLFGDAKGLGGASLEQKVIYRHGMLGIGGLAEQSTKVFDYKSFAFAPMVGVFAPGPKWLRAGVMGTAGARIYQDADGVGWFGSCPCGSGTLPFAGLRAIAGVDVWYLHIGAHAFADTDIGRIRGTLPGANGSLETYTVGTVRVGGGLAIGPRFDL
jgi:hypothetical protein